MFLIVSIGNLFGNLLSEIEFSVHAQSPPPCATPDPSANGQAGTWSPNGPVRVSINPYDFNAQERECLRQAFENWNNSNGAAGNNSGVYFRVEFSTNQVASLNASNQSVGVGTSPSFQVNRGTAPDGIAPAIVFPDSDPSDGRRTAAVALIDPRVTDCTAMTSFMAHEIGHTMGLGHLPNEATLPHGSSVMMGARCSGNPCVTNYNYSAGTTSPTTCDNARTRTVGDYNGTVCEPYAAHSCYGIGGVYTFATCTCNTGGSAGCQGGDFEGTGTRGWCDIENPTCIDGVDNDCDGLIDENDPDCICMSPIVIDTLGNGFSLTGVEAGVRFDMSGTGSYFRLSWIQGDEAWLALDRNGNGRIDSGLELFGNFTPQPPSTTPNGFTALAEYDKPENGGNSDGVLGSEDRIFSSLLLWQDINHNGISESGELHTLPSLNIESISLNYREIRRRDRHGNQFRYQAIVTGTANHIRRRLAYDVFLKAAP